MKNFNRSLFLLAFLTVSFFSNAAKYNILDFGAIPDTSQLSTHAIQQAINECSQAGGGTVRVPAGHFKTGSIVLKSNVNLHLENGAILFGSRNLDDYLKFKPEYISLRTQEATIQLIYAENASNVSITGSGQIDGQGSGFKKLSWNDEGITRPHLLRFITCKDILVENVSLRNSGCWMQHYLACDNIQIRGISVFNRNNYNNDGLDLDGCHNVTVSDFISDSDDDGITLKSTSPRACENITITNCVISSRCNAIKMGTESNGGFKNIAISNCVVKPSKIKEPTFFGEKTGIAGIALEIVDGGTMEGITINNIQIDGTESPIFIRLANRARPYKQGQVIDHIGKLGDISISNVTAKNTAKIGCSITGQPDFPVQNIRLSNISIENAGGGTMKDSERKVEYLPKEYPEATMFGVLPAYGFYIRHAENIWLDDIQLSTKSADQRPAYVLDNVKEGIISDNIVKGSNEAKTTILLKESEDVLIRGIYLTGSAQSLVTTKQSSKIQIINPILPKNTEPKIEIQ